MNFINPWFLIGAISLAIPVIVHLFNFRKYKVEYFTNTRLLKELLADTIQASKLKKRLLLASRLLALFCILMAFVQPYLGQPNTERGRILLSIYIDNSLSMDIYNESETLLSIAKSHAKDIVSQYRDRAVYQLITNDFGRNALQTYSYQEALSKIDDIQSTHDSKNLDQILDKQVKLSELQSADYVRYVWISDFQKQQATATSYKDLNVEAIVVKTEKVQNIYIDSVWLSAPIYKVGNDAEIIVRSKRNQNSIKEPYILNLKINNQAKAHKEVVYEVETRIDTFKFKIQNNGWSNIEVTLSEPNLKFDNTYYLSLFVDPKPTVGIADFGNASKYIQYAFLADQNFEIQNISIKNLSSEWLQKVGLIVLNQPTKLDAFDQNYITEMLKAGKNIVLFWPQNIDLAQTNRTLESLGVSKILRYSDQPAEVRSINTQSSLFRDLLSGQSIPNTDWPKVYKHYQLDKYAALPREVLMSLSNGYPFLVKYGHRHQGNLFIFTSPPDPESSTFVQSPLFAPALFKIGNASQNSLMTSYVISGHTQLTIPLKSSLKDITLKLRGQNTEIIPSQKLLGNLWIGYLNFSNIKPGFYLLDGGTNHQYKLALNAPRTESILEYLSPQQIKDLYSSLKIEVSEQVGKIKSTPDGHSRNSWTIWVIAALAFLIVEIILATIWDKLLSEYISPKLKTEVQPT